MPTFNYDQKSMNRVGGDLLKGLFGEAGTKSAPIPGRDDQGNYTETVTTDYSPAEKVGRAVKSVGEFAPGLGGIAFRGKEFYDKNKDRIPNVIGGITQELNQGRDPKYQALENLQDPNRNFRDDLSEVGQDIALNLGGKGLEKGAKYAKGALAGLGGGAVLSMSPAVANQRVRRASDGRQFDKAEALVETVANSPAKGGNPIERRLEMLNRIKSDDRLSPRQREYLSQQLDQPRESWTPDVKKNATDKVRRILPDDYTDFIDPMDYR